MTQPPQNTHIIAEDDFVRVLYHSGSSDFLLITFGDLITPANESRFFADTPVKKANISCLGFVAKSGNWYPKDSMLPLIEATKDYRGNHTTLVSYGGSMGGYAALKYSKALGSTHVLALCPQWSIDPSECQGIDPGWQDRFDARTLANMGIKPSDRAGAAFVFFDPYDKLDKFHAGRIARTSPTHLIPVPRVGHNVTPTLSGKDRLLNLIEYCRNDDISSINNLVRQCRVRSQRRNQRVLSFAEKRFPALIHERIEKLFLSEAVPELDVKYAVMGMKILAKNNNWEKLRLSFDYYRAKFEDFQRSHVVALYITDSTKSDACLTTSHNTVVCYDVREHCLIHCEAAQARHNDAVLPVRILMRGDLLWFYVILSELKIYIGCSSDKVVSYEPEESISLRVGHSGNRITCARGNAYLCAEPDVPKMAVNKSKAYEWEKFSVGIIENRRPVEQQIVVSPPLRQADSSLSRALHLLRRSVIRKIIARR